MSIQVGLTESQARKLIELAEKSGCLAKVRTFRKDTAHTHAGRAFLIGLVNKTEARIKPFTHRKEEIVPLTTLRFWKSGCDFDITEAETIVETETDAISVEVADERRFVIYSAKMGGVWAGSIRKWIKIVQSAIFYRDMERASSTLTSLQKSYATDAILITDVDAASRVAELSSARSQPQPQPILTQPVVTVHEQQPNKEFDLTNITNFDPILLSKAAQDYNAAVQEIKDAEALKQEAIRKLEEAKALIAKLCGTMTASEQKQDEPEVKRTLAKPGAVKNAIVSVLKTHSRLDLNGIVTRAMPLTPESTHGSVKQGVYKLKRIGLIEQNANGFALTAKGRSES